jgi:hypothetical protein
MPRTRKALSDKQERILVQCQLMGLTTQDMTQISNRLRVLDIEREFKKEVNEAIEGQRWDKKSKHHYIITDTEGRVYDCRMSLITGNSGWGHKETWTIVINKPGTRMKERVLKDKTLWARTDEIASVCPENDSRLFRLLQNIKKGVWK